ncbi:5-formyltetrahydrofolate cyclo-ligase [Clostridium oceanicum]|uniref:5-formyltetrahydrofolate cyclo-ligase n=2 Tax=Clostridium oceanicum TaxID=1543 RepID=A0ABN1JSY9_9CLOT
MIELKKKGKEKVREMSYKSILRKSMKQKRKGLSIDKKQNKDKIILEKLLNSSYYKKSRIIFVYVSMDEEIDTHGFIKKALNSGKEICVPKVISKDRGMSAIKIEDFSKLKPCGKYKILEPESFHNKIDEKYIDLVIVPGLVFDRKGGRIGYGGGFYDRLFLKLKDNTPKIALSYDFQVIEDVPIEEHDILIDGIITG